MSGLIRMDWNKVRLNGGPPCFDVLDDEKNWFCGRAQRWEGHDGDHAFVSLEAYVKSQVEAFRVRAIEAVRALSDNQLSATTICARLEMLPVTSEEAGHE